MEAGKSNRITIRLDHRQDHKQGQKQDLKLKHQRNIKQDLMQDHIQDHKQDKKQIYTQQYQDEKREISRHRQEWQEDSMTFTPSNGSDEITNDNMRKIQDHNIQNEDFPEATTPLSGHELNKFEHELQREVPYWQSEDMDDQDYSSYISKKKRPLGLIGWGKKMLHSSQLLIIAGSAIGVGLILGFLVLTLFSKLDQENLPVVYSQGVLQPSFTNTENSGQGATIGDTEDGAEAEASPSTELPSIIPSGQVEGNQLILPAKQFYIVQAGAFSTRDSALELAQTYTTNGYPYMMNENQDPIRLYVGFGFNREQMLLLGQFYQKEGYEVWVRELETEEIALAVEGASSEDLSQFSQYVTYAELFFEEANDLVVKGISTGADFTIGAEAWSSVQTRHRQLLDWRQQHFAAWPDELKVKATELHSSAQNTYHALEEYRSKRNQVFLWQALQSTLNYLDSYQSWQN